MAARTDKRKMIVQTATGLFSRYGYHAVGVDTIIEKAKVSKKTLYHHFASKDDLIVAVLETYDQDFRRSFVEQVEARAKSPMKKILAIYDVAEKWFRSDKYYGCMFISAASEYSGFSSPVRSICKQFKSLTRAYIQELVIEAGFKKPKELANYLALLFEGAIVTAQISKKSDSAKEAKKAAKMLINASAIEPKATVASGGRH